MLVVLAFMPRPARCSECAFHAIGWPRGGGRRDLQMYLLVSLLLVFWRGGSLCGPCCMCILDGTLF